MKKSKVMTKLPEKKMCNKDSKEQKVEKKKKAPMKKSSK